MQKVPIPPPGFAELTVDEKIDYVQSLWDHIAALPDQVPVPAWHRELLEERRQAYEANPTEGKSWEEVRDSITKKLSSIDE